MNSPKIRGKTDFSQPHSTQQPGSLYHHSTSPTPSFKSDRSNITTVEENSKFLDTKATAKRQKTQIAQVELSWWDCLKGVLLGPRKIAHKVVATLKTAEIGDSGIDMFDHKDCPFIRTVKGNIVSLSLAQKLGYTEFKNLNPRERNGGTSASGHKLQAEGAIHLTWYRSTSSQIFRDMRFLVSANAQCDLLVDIPKEDLTGKVAMLQSRLEDLKRELRHRPKDKKLNAKFERKQRQFTIANLELDMYKAQELVKGQPREDLETFLAEKQKEIDELKAKEGETKEKFDKEKNRKQKPSTPLQDQPDIKLLEPNGNNRTPTGLSLRHRQKN
ncbi:hypothetical protein AOQ84DRAFT_372240 [Glonium stellatum]|uniref:Uncharacterized protein n=1 Tax=Glonium stellatum TaxID=574774 RepID=A0A8E2FAE3_9PEZI|nr:hypothetical protein AOQ84DRAFT_372240 [Glonium stellatum]